MAGRFLKLSCVLTRCSAHERLSKTTIMGINICTNHCHTISVNPKASKEERRPNTKKKEQFSSNILDSNNKTDFYEIKSKEKVNSCDAQNLEANDIAEDLFKKKVQGIKNQTFNHSLASYISVCVYSGLHDSAFATLNHYRNLQIKSKISESLNLKPYNEVLKGIADQGDLNKMKEIMVALEDSMLKPDYNTIAYCLTCLGRNENTPRVTDEIKNTLEIMKKYKITLDEIFGKAFFPRDSLKWCLQAIERVIPSVKDKLEFGNFSKDCIWEENSYQNELVNKLCESWLIDQGKSPAEGTISHDKLLEMIQIQINNELNGYLEIPSIWKRKSTKEQKEEESKLWEEWNEGWRKNLSESIDKLRANMMIDFSNAESSPISDLPYLNVLNNEDIIDLVLQEVRNLCFLDLGAISYNELAYSFGQKIYNRFHIRYKESNIISPMLREVYENYCHWYLLRSNKDAFPIPRLEWNNILGKLNRTMNLNGNPIEWPYTVKLAIGHSLHKFMVKNLYVWKDGSRPKKAFSMSSEGTNQRFTIETSGDLKGIFDGLFENFLMYSTNEIPMLSPPVPWTDLNNGAYFFKNTAFIRLSNAKYHPIQYFEEEKVRNLYPAMDSLNALSSIPWRINGEMLDIITEMFNMGGWSTLGLFPNPNLNPEKRSLKTSHHKRILFMEQRNFNVLLKRLSLANYYRNSIFWFPHNADAQGRAFPISYNLNHQQPDVIRSFLQFAQGKKLGNDGLTWLKLHLVSLTGMRKQSSIDDRLKFVDEMMDEILDSAKNPLDGNKWWMKCSEPFQALSACKELVAALECENPEEYLSHLPIYQDGSCNGLQHHAALTKDKEGGTYVNLRPCDTPQDVYSRVVDLVKGMVKDDAKRGVNIAEFLLPFIERKLIKQTVIANLHGVRETNSFSSIASYLKKERCFPDDYVEAAGDYLAPKTYKCLAIASPGLKPLKDWIIKLTEGISQLCLDNVEFENPLGFPIIQRNRKEEKVFKWHTDLITTYIQGSMLQVPNVEYQKSANLGSFILNLDASHMMLTSLYCQQMQMTFVSVHDSFWTHSSNVPALRKVCREQFVQLYSHPVLENIAQFFIQKYSSHPNYKHCYTTLSEEDPTPASLETLLKNIPKKGDLDLNEVLQSTFFFI